MLQAVLSLVVTPTLVITVGLYVLSLSLLSDVAHPGVRHLACPA